MKPEVSIRIAGEAGQGTQTMGSVICKILKLAGLHIFANQDYMSRVRGGNNFFQIRAAEHPVYAIRNKCDIIVALDRASVTLHKESVTDDGVIVVDKDAFHIQDPDTRVLPVPMHGIVAEIGVNDLFVNSVACGVLVALAGVPFEYAAQVLRSVFSKKGESVVNSNIKAAQAGHEFSLAHHGGDAFCLPVSPGRERLLMDGNEALALGAIRAGCKFYSAYPMTPSTSIMETICHYAPAFSIVVEQAEDEIAAINMVIGASFAGVRAMTSTSGGGFALMGEGISLAGMTETPVVIVDGQRPAPATGFPTRTEQADLDLVIHSGHGEFARAVFAPGTAQEAFAIMPHAFGIAEKYQVPVVILSDQHLADSQCTVDASSLRAPEPRRYVISKEESLKINHYQRYAITESGISPRAVPLWIKEAIYVDSDEHTPEGHITEDAAIRVKMVEKRFLKKTALLEREILPPTADYLENADVVLVGFGSTYGVMRECAQTAENRKVGFIHISQVWPFPVVEVTEALKNAKMIVTIENNAGAQLAKLMRRETGIAAHHSILKYDGRPFDTDSLVLELNRK